MMALASPDPYFFDPYFSYFSLSSREKFEKCIQRADWACPNDDYAQNVCGLCQVRAEDKCRSDLWMDTGKDIVSPWWL